VSVWNLQSAKAKLSEVVDKARAGEPQIILRRGSPAAAVISMDEYERLKPRTPLISFLLHSPFAGSELEIPRLNDAYEPHFERFEDEDA
jgi:prevent-host-death family protein